MPSGSHGWTGIGLSPEMDRKSNNTSLMWRTMRRKGHGSWGDTATMLSEPSREGIQTKNRRHHVTLDGDIYKVPTTSKCQTYPHHQHSRSQSHFITSHSTIKTLAIESFQPDVLQPIANRQQRHSKWSPNRTAFPTATPTATRTATLPPPSAST